MDIKTYDRAIERFTWREQLNGNGDKILSDVYKQTAGNCAAFAIAAVFEGRLRVKGINTILSRECIDRLDTRSTVPETKVWLMLKALRTHGAVEEEMPESGNRHKLSWYEAYCLQDASQLSRALKDLVTNGPLIAVLNISINYQECFESKHVYRFDPRRPLTYRKGGERKVFTHAVCVVGFSIL